MERIAKMSLIHIWPRYTQIRWLKSIEDDLRAVS